MNLLNAIKPRIRAVLGKKPVKFIPPTDGKTRLNLGCGDKVLEGFINVDVAPARKGNEPDIISDIKNLSVIEDNYADEVMAIHVVEHFYYWEVFDLLKEWKRVLKPGGKIILECPNILHAAKMLLKNPSEATSSTAAASMWVMYGDPGWKDPLMCHRWGYSPDSLKKVLEEVGFKDVMQERAIFKKREPRDMRITGIKPEYQEH